MSLFNKSKPPKDTFKPSQWIFIKKNIGKKKSQYDCFYCGLKHNKVEMCGMFYCPNPRCNGPGSGWFNSKLSSYKQNSDKSGYTIDSEEREKVAIVYLEELEKEYKEDRNVKEVKKPADCKLDSGLIVAYVVSSKADHSKLVVTNEFILESKKECLELSAWLKQAAEWIDIK